MLLNLIPINLTFARLTNHVNKLTVIGPVLSKKFDVIESCGTLLCFTFQLDTTLLPMLNPLLIDKFHLAHFANELRAIKCLHGKSIYILDDV